MSEAPEIGAQIVLRADARPARLAGAGQARPEHHGRAGLLVLLTDGSSREITYDAAQPRELAIAWICWSARVGESEIAAACDWSAKELEHEQARERIAALNARRDDAELRRLLG